MARANQSLQLNLSLATYEDCPMIDIQEGNQLSTSVTEVGECSTRGVKRKTSECPPWQDLPPDIIYNIFSRLEATDLTFGAPYCCKSWYDVSLDASLWKEVEMPMEIGMRNMMLGPNEEIEAAEEQAMGMDVEEEEKDITPMEGAVNERQEVVGEEEMADGVGGEEEVAGSAR